MAYRRWVISLSLLVAWVLLGAIPSALADDQCKPAAPLPQSKCQKDAQCCSGLVCAPSGGVKGCQAGCRIGGVFYASGTANPTNACQACQPSVSTTAWANKTNGTACTDGNACTQTDTCQTGVCTGSNSVVCAAPDQCHTAGTCDTNTGACSNPAQADGTACSDGNACTQTDTCQTGVCTGSNPVVCAAPDQCHTAGTCDTNTGVCSNPNAPDGTTCDDANACTQGDTCEAGACGTPVPDGTTCDDGSTSTLTDTCTAGTCGQCVPSTVASPSFVDNGDGTITDRQTCLVWEKKDGVGGGAALANLHDVDNTYNWSDATTIWIAAVNAEGGTGFAGHNDWRVPTSAGGSPCCGFPTGEPAELESIVDLSQGFCGGGSGACIDPIFGPTAASVYWSSSSYAGIPAAAWYVYFFDGSVGANFESTPSSVRAVRGGP